MKKSKKKLPGWVKIFLFVTASVVLWTAFIIAEQQAQNCGGASSGAQNATSVIAHAPTISTQTIEWEIHSYHSPLSAADVAYIYQESQQYTIDDAFAVAQWAQESHDGAAAVPGTDNIGNIVSSNGVGASAAGHIFQRYSSWQAGIDAWFAQTERYIKAGYATDLLTYALRYVDGLTLQEATPAEKTSLQNGYIADIQTIIGRMQKYEAQHSGGSSASSGGSSTQALTLASLIPDNLLPGWAGAGALQAATLIPLEGCTATGGTSTDGTNPMVLAAMQLAAHLEPDENGSFDVWGAGTPSGVLSQNGITWCTDFVASVYQRASGKSFTHYPNATDWLDNPAALQPGFVKVLAGPNSFPQAGDIIVLQDGSAGHVAVAVGVQLPQGGQNGWVLVAQGHATHALEKWTLYPNGTLTPNWGYWTYVPGYIRIPALDPKPPVTSNLNDYPWQGLTSGGDPWGMAYGQCVSYVAWKIYELYGGTQHPPTVPDRGWAPSNASIIPITWNWGDAGSWANSARNAGFLVEHTPQVGDVAQWNYGSDNGQFAVGHVAFVYQVNSDGSIELAQYNLRGDSKFSTLHMTRQGAWDTSNGHGPFFVSWPDNFIHFNTRASAAINSSADAATPQQTYIPGTNNSILPHQQASAHENWWANPPADLMFAEFLAADMAADRQRRAIRAAAALRLPTRAIGRPLWEHNKIVIMTLA